MTLFTPEKQFGCVVWYIDLALSFACYVDDIHDVCDVSLG